MRLLSQTVMVILAMLLFFLTGAASAAKVLTLDDCIELALKNRELIIRAHGDETKAGADKKAALGAFLPRLDASYSNSRSRSTGTGRDLPNETVSGIASLWLVNLANWFNYFGAAADRERAHLDVISKEQDLIYSVKFAYYAYLASQEAVAVQEQAVKRSEEQLKLTQSKYELGSAALSDVLKQKVQFGNDRLALLSAQNAAVNDKAELAYTIGIDPNKDHEFSTDYVVRQYDGALQDAVDFGLQHEPTLLQADMNTKVAGLALKSRLSEYLPTLSAFSRYNWSEGTLIIGGLPFSRESEVTSYGLSISWTIFDGFQRERRITNAKIARNNSRADLANTRYGLIRDIKIAYNDIEKLKEQQLVSSENVEAAQEDQKITQEKYNLGAATILDLLTSQESLTGAQVSLLRAEFDLNLAIAKLENSMGKM